MQSVNPDHREVVYETVEPPFSVSHFVAILKGYSSVILIAVLAVVLFYTIVALAIFLLVPSKRTTSIPFRLEFSGASEGRYPNGLKFSTNDIVNTPILLRIYEQNGLKDYLPFAKFAKSLFIVQENREYERLEAEYQARLKDTKLSPVDRERIENEFDAKRAALSKAEYAISYLAVDRSATLPDKVLRKVLGDVLSEWASYAANTQHAMLHDIATLSPGFVDVPSVAPDNYLVALQLLRSKVTHVRSNVSAIAQIPGVQLVRAGNGTTLEELRLQLDDLVRFRIEPQLAVLRSSGLIKNREFAIQYLQSQLSYDQRRLRSHEHEADAIRQTLAAYTQSELPVRGGREESPTPSSPAQARPSDVVMPQLNETFIDRIVEMSNFGADQKFRQELAEQLRAATLQTISVREAVDFDQELLDLVRQGSAVTLNLTPEQIVAEIAAVKNELKTIISTLNEIHATVSRSLNPSTTLFTVAGPAISRLERTITLPRLGLYGILFILVSIPLIIIGCFLHYRMREEVGDVHAPTTPATGPI